MAQLTERNFRLGKLWGIGRVLLAKNGRITGPASGKSFVPLANICLNFRVYADPMLPSPFIDWPVIWPSEIRETLRQIFRNILPPTARVCPKMWEDRAIPPEGLSMTSSILVRRLHLTLPYVDGKFEDYRDAFDGVSFPDVPIGHQSPLMHSIHRNLLCHPSWKNC